MVVVEANWALLELAPLAICSKYLRANVSSFITSIAKETELSLSKAVA